MARNLRMPERLFERGQFGFFDDFLNYTDAQFWTKLATGGTVAIANVEPVGSVLQFVGDGTIEHECSIYGTNAFFLPQAGKPIVLEACCEFAQAATNKIEVAFGLTNLATTAGLMTAAGAGPIASGSQVLLYTVNGDTNWHCQTRNGSTVSDTASNTPATPDTNFHTLTIEIQEMSTTQAVVTFAVDGIRLKPSSGVGNTYPDISHLLTYASLARSRPVFYLRQGAGSAETVNLDYFGGWQLRSGNALLF